mgnify:CR=1 FL=1
MLARTLMTLMLLFTAVGISGPATAADRFILLQSTTPPEHSGLYADLLPRFEADSGIEVRVVAVGTGQALRNAGNGDGDVLIVHARAAEDAFVADENLPDALAGRRYYEPTDRGAEVEIGERLRAWRARKDAAR